MQKIINCTPHDVVLYSEKDIYYDNDIRAHVLKPGVEFIVCFQPSGTVARCDYEECPPLYVHGIPIVRMKYTNITGLPPKEEGTYYIVSSIVGKAGSEMGRDDLIVPAKLVRDRAGNVVGCLAFGKS